MAYYTLNLDVDVEYYTLVEASSEAEAIKLAETRELFIPGNWTPEEWSTNGPWEFPNLGINETYDVEIEEELDDDKNVYRVSCYVSTPFEIEIEADSEDEAIEKAYEEEVYIPWPGEGTDRIEFVAGDINEINRDDIFVDSVDDDIEESLTHIKTFENFKY